MFHVNCLLGRQFTWNFIPYLLCLTYTISIEKSFFFLYFFVGGGGGGGILSDNIFFFLLEIELLMFQNNTFFFFAWNWIIDVSKQYFFFFCLKLNYWCFKTILWKFQKNWTNGTCWKSASKLLTLHISAQFAFFLTMGKNDSVWFFKNKWKLIEPR